MSDLNDSLRKFIRDHANWSNATFGDEKERGPIGPLKHLSKEVGEAQVAERGSIHQLEELADCGLLLFDALRRAGFTVDELVDMMTLKLRVCKTRNYAKPTSDEPSEHERPSA